MAEEERPEVEGNHSHIPSTPSNQENAEQDRPDSSAKRVRNRRGGNAGRPKTPEEQSKSMKGREGVTLTEVFSWLELQGERFASKVWDPHMFNDSAVGNPFVGGVHEEGYPSFPKPVQPGYAADVDAFANSLVKATRDLTKSNFLTHLILVFFPQLSDVRLRIRKKVVLTLAGGGGSSPTGPRTSPVFLMCVCV